MKSLKSSTDSLLKELDNTIKDFIEHMDDLVLSSKHTYDPSSFSLTDKDISTCPPLPPDTVLLPSDVDYIPPYDFYYLQHGTWKSDGAKHFTSLDHKYSEFPHLIAVKLQYLDKDDYYFKHSVKKRSVFGIVHSSGSTSYFPEYLIPTGSLIYKVIYDSKTKTYSKRKSYIKL